MINKKKVLICLFAIGVLFSATNINANEDKSELNDISYCEFDENGNEVCYDSYGNIINPITTYGHNDGKL